LNLCLSIQQDPIFDTQVAFNVGFNLSGSQPRRNRGSSVLARLGDSVERTSTISVDEQTKNDRVVATDSRTGNPLIFRHVNLGSEGGDGTFEHPTGTVQSALNVAKPSDIVYVQPGTNPGIPIGTNPGTNP